MSHLLPCHTRLLANYDPKYARTVSLWLDDVAATLRMMAQSDDCSSFRRKALTVALSSVLEWKEEYLYEFSKKTPASGGALLTPSETSSAMLDVSTPPIQEEV